MIEGVLDLAEFKIDVPHKRNLILPQYANGQVSVNYPNHFNLVFSQGRIFFQNMDWVCELVGNLCCRIIRIPNLDTERCFLRPTIQFKQHVVHFKRLQFVPIEP